MKKTLSAKSDTQQQPTSVPDYQLEIAQLKEQVLRSQADYQNLVRRTQEDRLKFAKMAGEEVLVSLLQPLDHLEMATKQLQDPGLKMVLQQFEQVLAQFGVAEIECLGREFDVNTMEVAAREDDQPVVEGKVKEIIRKGYTLNGSVIRHAKVVVT